LNTSAVGVCREGRKIASIRAAPRRHGETLSSEKSSCARMADGIGGGDFRENSAFPSVMFV
jgi:hypothetical protein